MSTSLFDVRAPCDFGDGNCGADEINTRARNFEETRREGSAPLVSRPLEISCVYVCVFRPPHNQLKTITIACLVLRRVICVRKK